MQLGRGIVSTGAATSRARNGHDWLLLQHTVQIGVRERIKQDEHEMQMQR